MIFILRFTSEYYRQRVENTQRHLRTGTDSENLVHTQPPKDSSKQPKTAVRTDTFTQPHAARANLHTATHRQRPPQSTMDSHKQPSTLARRQIQSHTATDSHRP